MKAIGLIVLLLTIFGCATAPKHDFQPGTRIAVILSPDQFSLCHKHRAVTVFGNIDKRYDPQLLDVNVYQTLSESFEQVAVKNGHEAVMLSNADFWVNSPEYYAIKGGGDSINMTEKGLAMMQEIQQQQNADVVAFIPNFFGKNSRQPKGCPFISSISILTSANLKYTVVDARLGFRLFNLDDAKQLGLQTGIGGVLGSNTLPENLKELTSKDFKQASYGARESLNNGVRDFFHDVGLGEHDFRGPTGSAVIF